jgi:hypothetical protein
MKGLEGVDLTSCRSTSPLGIGLGNAHLSVVISDRIENFVYHMTIHYPDIKSGTVYVCIYQQELILVYKPIFLT